MCDQCVPSGGWPQAWSRRGFLTAAAAAVAASGARSAPSAAAASSAPTAGRRGGLAVFPRSAWAGDSRPPGALVDEPDVRFLLVHHTVNANDYAPEDVAVLLRNIHAFHTGPERGWPDVAYNFVVDRFGGIWEARTGSLDRTVAGDATGGNQGFDQKCAFLGDHSSVPPSDEAQQAMVALLAWLAERSGIDTRAGATTTFVSRGSNRHPAGTEVQTSTIAGHRQMSLTTCPGDAGFAVVRDRLPVAVTAAREGPSPATSGPTSSTAPPATPTTAPATSAVAPTSVPAPAAPPVTASGEIAGGAAGGTDEFPLSLPALGAAGAAAVVLGSVLARRSRVG